MGRSTVSEQQWIASKALKARCQGETVRTGIKESDTFPLQEVSVQLKENLPDGWQ